LTRLTLVKFLLTLGNYPLDTPLERRELSSQRRKAKKEKKRPPKKKRRRKKKSTK
jgi:hypothetical protein